MGTNKFITLLDKSYEELLSMNLSLSCSCGKDSLCIALYCANNNIPLKQILFYTNGTEFSCILDTWERLKEYYHYKNLNTKFIRIQGTDLQNSILSKVRGYYIGREPSIGFINCGYYSRFGTTDKIKKISELENNCTPIIGIAKDENRAIEINCSYLLLELGYTEETALQYCYEYGFYWEQFTDIPGITIRMYDYIDRSSCCLCSFMDKSEIVLYYTLFYNTVWKRILYIQTHLDVPYFKNMNAFNVPFYYKNEIDKLRKSFNL